MLLVSFPLGSSLFAFLEAADNNASVALLGDDVTHPLDKKNAVSIVLWSFVNHSNLPCIPCPLAITRNFAMRDLSAFRLPAVVFFLGIN